MPVVLRTNLTKSCNPKVTLKDNINIVPGLVKIIILTYRHSNSQRKTVQVCDGSGFGFGEMVGRSLVDEEFDIAEEEEDIERGARSIFLDCCDTDLCNRPVATTTTRMATTATTVGPGAVSVHSRSLPASDPTDSTPILDYVTSTMPLNSTSPVATDSTLTSFTTTTVFVTSADVPSSTSDSVTTSSLPNSTTDSATTSKSPSTTSDNRPLSTQPTTTTALPTTTTTSKLSGNVLF